MSQDWEGRNLHDISLKMLHQAGFETARQAATSAERHALTIAPCPSLYLRSFAFTVNSCCLYLTYFWKLVLMNDQNH